MVSPSVVLYVLFWEPMGGLLETTVIQYITQRLHPSYMYMYMYMCAMAAICVPTARWTTFHHQPIEQAGGDICHQFRPHSEGLAGAVEVQQLQVAGDSAGEQTAGVNA